MYFCGKFVGSLEYKMRWGYKIDSYTCNGLNKSALREINCACLLVNEWRIVAGGLDVVNYVTTSIA